MPANLRATRLPPSLCPDCGHKLDAATGMDSTSVPKPGDWTVCINCAAVLVFDPLLRPVRPDPGALAAEQLVNPNLVTVLRHAQARVRKLPVVKAPPRGNA